MIFAITGGTGFVGRSLIARIAGKDDQIRVLSRRIPGSGVLPAAVQVYPGDLAHDGGAQALASFVDGADVIIHGAGEIRETALMRALHVEGTQRLLAAAQGKVRRWVQLSSVGAYGPRRQAVFDEQSATAPVGEYEITKTEADRLVLAAADGAFEVVVLRPSIVFGPSMPNRSLYQLVSLVESGWFGFVGPRGAMANYVFVDDVAEALWLCATAPNARGVYNLSDDRRMEAFVASIAIALGRPVPEFRLPEAPLRLAAMLLERFPGAPLTQSRVDALSRRAVYPSDRIRRELGFEFGIGVEEGLRRLVADWRNSR
jgi:nucleoside-diphosphate-sugar epimerase